MKVILVDDERSALITLGYKLHKYDPSIEILTICEEPEIALEVIPELNPDVVFLDIEMPRLSGFELLNKLAEINFEVVFVTAHNEFILTAFRDNNAFDYLLKPIIEVELKGTLDKLNTIIKNKKDAEYFPSHKNLAEINSNNHDFLEKKKNLYIVATEGIYMVPLADILYLEADESFTHIHRINNRKITTSKTLAEYDDLVITSSFYRIHRKYIININLVDKYIREKGDTGGYVYLLNGSEKECKLPVSRREKLNFIDKLKSI